MDFEQCLQKLYVYTEMNKLLSFYCPSSGVKLQKNCHYYHLHIKTLTLISNYLEKTNIEAKNQIINELSISLKKACLTSTRAEAIQILLKPKPHVKNGMTEMIYTSYMIPETGGMATEEHKTIIDVVEKAIEDPIALTVLYKLINYLKRGRPAGPGGLQSNLDAGESVTSIRPPGGPVIIQEAEIII
jgi:hypothetical protein